MASISAIQLHLASTTPFDLQRYGVIIALLALALLFVRDATRRPNRQPPQITPLPDRQRPWLHWESCAKQPGHEDLMSSVTGGRINIILNSAEAVNELFEKRSSNFSSRPHSQLGTIALRNLGGATSSHRHPSFKPWRKLLHSVLSSRAAENYIPWQTSESVALLHGLLEQPEHWDVLMKAALWNTVSLLSYGIRSQDASKDPAFVQHFDTVEKHMRRLGGSSLVETYPILRWTPDFLARRYLPELLDARTRFDRDTPTRLSRMEAAKSRNDNGWPVWSMVRAAFEAEGGWQATGLSYVALAYTMSTPFHAGIDTTYSQLALFLWACITQGEHFISRARQELDKVVGHERLPSLDDELPFCDAVLKEAARHGRGTPIAIPHASVEAGQYNGFDVPAGATITPNNWTISRDPRVYKDPDAFRPDRWLDGSSPFSLPIGLFGHGRRACPGAPVAVNTLNIFIRRLLWGFDITSTDSSYRGNDYANWKSLGILTWPDDLPLRITPRSMKHAKIIRQEFKAVKPDLDAMVPN